MFLPIISISDSILRAVPTTLASQVSCLGRLPQLIRLLSHAPTKATRSLDDVEIQVYTEVSSLARKLKIQADGRLPGHRILIFDTR